MCRKLMMCVFLLFFVGCSGAAQRGALSRAYHSYNDGDYEDVLRLTSQAQSYKKPTYYLNAQILFLKAMALEKLERDKEALGVFKFLADHYSDTKYGEKAKEKIK